MAPRDIARRSWPWFRQHQQTIRDWLILFAAVIAGLVGWQQIEDERNARKEAERDTLRLERRAQAEEIAAWQGVADSRSLMPVIISNSSQHPVYQAVVSRVAVEGSGAHTGRQIPEEIAFQEQQTVLVIPPGRTRIDFDVGFGGMGRVLGFEIAFKDQAGRNWVRYANGSLKEIEQRPIGYYGLDRPVLWR